MRALGKPNTNNGIFALIPYYGKKPLSATENGYMVNDGVCYSTFTYDSGSYIPIENMNTALALGKDYAVYIKFGIASNMQVTGAKVMCSIVGKDAKPDEWQDYPDYYKIRPQDTTDDKGRVTKIVDGKRQESCFLMIGKCMERESLSDFDKNYNISSVVSAQNKWSGIFIQYVDSNIIMMGSQISGVPVVFPMPFWGGPATSDKNKLKPK
jgi:hypothetical protein